MQNSPDWSEKAKLASRGVDKTWRNQCVKLPSTPLGEHSPATALREMLSRSLLHWELLSNLFPLLTPPHLQHCGRNKQLFSVESRTSFCSSFSFVSGLFLSFVSPLYSVSSACTSKRLIVGSVSEGEF